MANILFLRLKGRFLTLPALFLAGFMAGILAVILAGATSNSVQAAAGPWVDDDQARLRLIAASDGVGSSGALRLGLQFDLRPGWKIYWRSPGDAGYPPSIDWNSSDNLAAVEMTWPVPHRFSLFGLETFGYGDEVVLPITAQATQPGQAVTLRAVVSYLICEEICVPHDSALTLALPAALPAGPDSPSAEATLIDKYQALVPGDGSAVGLTLERAVLEGTIEAPVIAVAARSETAFTAPDLLVEGPPRYSYGKPEITFSDGGKRVVLRVPVTPGPTAKGVLEGKRLTLTVSDGARAMEQRVRARFANPQLAAGIAGNFAAMLGLALLGGLILNLMPCVLPVLSLKLLSVVNQGGRAHSEVRGSFLASAAGIVFSFMVLAAAAVALKLAGLSVGWGIQFQQPLFLVAMTLILTLFAWNLLGLFEIPLPAWLTRAAMGADGHGRGGHFATGAFATLLATPCSAPFLGTAVGFALARGPFEIFLIFLMLGIGLALPYLLVAAVPGLATRLPRPGPWMIWLRRVLGLALAGTAVWLLTILSVQSGGTAAWLVGALMLAVGLAFWLSHHFSARSRFIAPALVILLAAAAFVVPVGLDAPPADASLNDQTGGKWQALDEAHIDSLVAQGKTVFVDVTAEWCITCQVNKKLVIDNDAVMDRLTSETVVTMRGDWTLPNDEIARYLESFGRYGIPFNAVYGPAAPDGIALPELLSIDAVLTALDRAAGG